MTEMAAPAPVAPPRSLTDEPGWWGMVLLVATEAALFLILLAAYFYVRVRSGGDWPQGSVPDPALSRPGGMTAALVAASGAAAISAGAALRGAQALLRAAIAVTVLLALLSIGLEAWDWSVSLDRYTPHTNAYGSLYYTIDGLHGAHVAVGVLLSLWTLALALAGRVTPTRSLAVRNVALYWHFAAASWVVVFVSLHLSVAL
jgi:heme/copper-type cytochrome/quinol oxidase subunit 3